MAFIFDQWKTECIEYSYIILYSYIEFLEGGKRVMGSDEGRGIDGGVVGIRSGGEWGVDGGADSWRGGVMEGKVMEGGSEGVSDVE